MEVNKSSQEDGDILSTGVLVCITQQKTCERLIRKGSELKNDNNGHLYVIHVSRKDLNFLDNTSEGEALQYLFNVSSAAGASLTVLKSDNVANTIAQYAKDNNVADIVLGASPVTESKSVLQTESSHVAELKKKLPNINFHIVSP